MARQPGESSMSTEPNNAESRRRDMRRISNAALAGTFLLASSLALCSAAPPEPKAPQQTESTLPEVAESHLSTVTIVRELIQQLSDINQKLSEGRLDEAQENALRAVAKLHALVISTITEQSRTEALARDLDAARAEVAALKPQAAAQQSLTQERKKAEQREAELTQ